MLFAQRGIFFLFFVFFSLTKEGPSESARAFVKRDHSPFVDLVLLLVLLLLLLVVVVVLLLMMLLRVLLLSLLLFSFVVVVVDDAVVFVAPLAVFAAAVLVVCRFLIRHCCCDRKYTHPRAHAQGSQFRRTLRRPTMFTGSRRGSNTPKRRPISPPTTPKRTSNLMRPR